MASPMSPMSMRMSCAPLQACPPRLLVADDDAAVRSLLAEFLGAELGLSAEQMRSLEFGSLLHDIGKIGVPDAVLRKPAKLTEDEWMLMREHPLHGRKILGGIEFLEGAAKVV